MADVGENQKHFLRLFSFYRVPIFPILQLMGFEY